MRGQLGVVGARVGSLSNFLYKLSCIFRLFLGGEFVTFYCFFDRCVAQNLRIDFFGPLFLAPKENDTVGTAAFERIHDLLYFFDLLLGDFCSQVLQLFEGASLQLEWGNS